MTDRRAAPAAVLVGPPGAGKTTTGRVLASRLGCAYRDVDDDIVAAAGKSISDIFTEDGEDAFRALEERAVVAALASHTGVLGLGGGAVLSARTRELLRSHTVVFCHVGLSEGVRRTGLSTARPLLAGVNPRATFRAMLAERLPLYREVATVEVTTDGRGQEQVAGDALAALAENASADVDVETRQ